MTDNIFLSQLIQSGPDAQSNLYRAKFTLEGELKASQRLIDEEIFLSVRLTKYNSPARSIQTISLPYQNISLQIPVVSSTLENKLSLTFRLDNNYKLYKLLGESLPLKSTGESGLGEESLASIYKNKTWKIEIHCYNGTEDSNGTMYKDVPGEADGAITWTYSGCKLLNIPSLGYGYGNAGAMEVSCDFIYEKCEESVGSSGP